MSFTEKQKLEVWSRAKAVDGFNPDLYRKDACDAWIIWDKYSDTDSLYGWEIDHVVPESLLVKKGFDRTQIDDNANLRALNWRNNRSKADDYPHYTAAVVSQGVKNVVTEKHLSVNEVKREKLYKLFGI